MTAEIICRQCNTPFSSYGELADHIIEKGKSHQKSRRWALKYKGRALTRVVVEYKHVSEDPDKVHTDFGEENRENRNRRLSGETNYVNAICPKCHKVHRPLMECDFIQDWDAWRIENRIVKLCGACEH